MSDKQKVNELKEEGNALFVKQKYVAAAQKYSKALEYDGENAILYANRAACALGLKDYAHASGDAKKATELDPKYMKAWARLATARAALGDSDESIEAWNKALALLSNSNLSPSESKLKEQAETGLRLAKAQKQKAQSVGIIVQDGETKMPWHRAKAMLPMLRRLGNARASSSAWVISAAYDDFASGVQKLKSMKQTPTPQGMQYSVPSGALEDLTNGAIRDSRVFHITDNKWLEMYNTQVMMDCQMFGAWTGESSQVIAEAPVRQCEKGWGAVRIAVSTTIRAWMVRALLADQLMQNHVEGLQFYDRILDVLQWGRQAWRSVPREDRGSVFEDTFMRGVRSLRLTALMDVACTSNADPDFKYTLNDLYEEAQDIIREVDAALLHPLTGDFDPGFISSFYLYPKGNALSMIGSYHNKMAIKCL